MPSIKFYLRRSTKVKCIACGKMRKIEECRWLESYKGFICLECGKRWLQ